MHRRGRELRPLRSGLAALSITLGFTLAALPALAGDCGLVWTVRLGSSGSSIMTVGGVEPTAQGMVGVCTIDGGFYRNTRNASPPFASEFEPLTPARGRLWSLQLVSGEVFIAWAEFTAWDQSHVRFARVPADASLAPVQLSDRSGLVSSVALVPEPGGFVVLFIQSGPDSPGLHHLRIDSDGNVLQPDSRILDDPDLSSLRALASDPAISLSWWHRTLEEQVFARIERDGSWLAPPRQDLSSGDVGRSLAMAWDGSRHLVAWADQSNALDGQVRLRFLDAMGEPLGPAWSASGSPPLSRPFHPDLAFTGDGHVLAWVEETPSEGSDEIFLQRLDADGLPATKRTQITHEPDESPAFVRLSSWDGPDDVYLTHDWIPRGFGTQPPWVKYRRVSCGGFEVLRDGDALRLAIGLADDSFSDAEMPWRDPDEPVGRPDLPALLYYVLPELEQVIRLRRVGDSVEIGFPG